IGLLAALALRLRGAEVCGLDVVDENSMRPQWLKTIGGDYIDGRNMSPQQMGQHGGPFEIIFEATGVPSLEFNLLDALATNGAYVLTGIPMGDRPVQVPGAELLRGVVLKNQAMLGSVNAARDHYQTAVDNLARGRLLWGDHITKLITQRYRYDGAAATFHKHEADEIKVVIEWK
ncbi:MAG TPA: zinc-binding dehydrogenase, partial [Ramlibacter sp.]|nr:zinc-binding dehydrogenase [Ramlibacter sp.]